MEYHNNKARFRGAGPSVGGPSVSIASGYFKITGLSITSGQDPETRNKVGQTVYLDGATPNGPGIIEFSVGRSGSTSVASWWKSRLTANQCTFNSTPDKLNFAFQGKLFLMIDTPVPGRIQAEFDDVFIGQGHTGTANNWWFGGKNCSYTNSNTVICKGLRVPHNTPISIEVTRGSNDSAVNIFDVRNFQVAIGSDWMASVPNDRKLRDITLPGSHNAGMSVTSHCAPPGGIADGATKNQKISVAKQLEIGARYLELRVDYDYGELVTYHRQGQWGCNGESLETVLSAVDSFLSRHPAEMVVLKFSHIRDDSGHDPANTKRLLDDRVSRLSKLYRNASVVSDGVYLANLPISSFRGKALALFSYNDYISPANGRFYFSNNLAAHVWLYDEYSNTNNYASMKSDQVRKWEKQADLKNIFLLSWTLTSNGIDSVEFMAKEANEKLPAVLSEYRGKYKKPAIIAVDFLDEAVAQAIIGLNI